MAEIQLFNNEMFGTIRNVMIGNKPYFVGKDIAEKLGYARPTKAIQDHCKGVLKQDFPTEGGKQEMSVISESDVYRLIIKSKLPQAEQFEKWVMEDVLPSIRKHGAYMTENTIEKALTNPDFLIQLATNLKDEQEKRRIAEEEKRKAELLVEAKEEIIQIQKIKVEYHDNVLKPNRLMTATMIAKDLGISARQLNALLCSKRIIFKQGKAYVLYAKHQDKVPTYADYEISEFGQQLKWTEIGRKWIIEEVLKEELKIIA